MDDVAAPWADWVLVSLAAAPDGRLPSVAAVAEEVAIRFADRFGPDDRGYLGELSRWQVAVAGAVAHLRTSGLVRAGGSLSAAPDAMPDDRLQVLTAAGRERASAVRAVVESAPPPPPEPAPEPAGAGRAPLLSVGVIAPPLRLATARHKVGFPVADDRPGPVMAELNLHHRGGARGALARLTDLWQRVAGPDRGPTALGDEYATGSLSLREMKRLVSADTAGPDRRDRALRRIWPDFTVREQIDASCVTVKADAARRSFNAYGAGIVWAVIDTGIDANHPHFATYRTLSHESVADLHRCFPLEGEPSDDPKLALTDDSGHGTHVAGIIAGSIGPWLAAAPGRTVQATESRYNIEQPDEPLRVPRTVEDPSMLAGMAAKAKLVSLKVLQAGGTEQARVARLIRALEYVREVNGDGTDSMRIHGVNLSLGYDFEPEWFACGQSPLCKEVDKLVRSGVVVVVAAGNSGYGSLAVAMDAPSRFGLGMTINDPGNAADAITVGSTHRDAPHEYGVSYFSSKGPTGDGRPKPDLVAPGERISSCAAGRSLAAVIGTGEIGPDVAVYVEDTGTSMAAPHVSGAAAALMSLHRELIGEPDDVKSLLVRSALDLHRHPDFQGAGLLDLMHALQLV